MPGVAERRAIDLPEKCWREMRSGFYRAVRLQRIPALIGDVEKLIVESRCRDEDAGNV
jgi:hypothetical protein